MTATAPLPPPDRRMGAKEAAAYLGLDRNTLDVWRKKERGPAFYRLWGIIFYDRADLDAFAAQSRVETVAARPLGQDATPPTPQHATDDADRP